MSNSVQTEQILKVAAELIDVVFAHHTKCSRHSLRQVFSVSKHTITPYNTLDKSQNMADATSHSEIIHVGIFLKKFQKFGTWRDFESQ